MLNPAMGNQLFRQVRTDLSLLHRFPEPQTRRLFPHGTHASVKLTLYLSSVPVPLLEWIGHKRILMKIPEISPPILTSRPKNTNWHVANNWDWSIPFSSPDNLPICPCTASWKRPAGYVLTCCDFIFRSRNLDEKGENAVPNGIPSRNQRFIGNPFLRRKKPPPRP